MEKQYQNIENHPLFTTWVMMRQRCNNVNHSAYYLYGGRGIRVCDRWNNSFAAFVEDVGVKPSELHTIDRYPNKNGDYAPANFRWATWAEQNSNRNGYATIKIRIKKNMAYAAYIRKCKIDEKFDPEDLVNSVREKYPLNKIVFDKSR